MELLLNLLWFAIVAGGVITYLRAKPTAHNRFQLGLGALLCVSALLLPAISITDDLHFDAFAVEDSSPIKKLAQAEAHASPVSYTAWFGISLLALLLAARRRSTWNACVPCCEVFPNLLFARPVLGRAPPRRIISSGIAAA